MNKFKKLGIEGSLLISSPVYNDNRGYFCEWFRGEWTEKNIGNEFKVAQGNFSRSKKGVIRGIHASNPPNEQGKWITCVNGAIWDVVVDIRPTSPTFCKWHAVELKAGDGKSLFISEGLGHAFVALEDDSVISYLLSKPYNPESEFTINPFDTEIAINWPFSSGLLLSERDQTAKSLREHLNTFNEARNRNT